MTNKHVWVRVWEKPWQPFIHIKSTNIPVASPPVPFPSKCLFIMLIDIAKTINSFGPEKCRSALLFTHFCTLRRLRLDSAWHPCRISGSDPHWMKFLLETEISMGMGQKVPSGTPKWLVVLDFNSPKMAWALIIPVLLYCSGNIIINISFSLSYP